ncbi:Nucleolar protein 10 [Nosema granulosis]|uniref:Nucleolar protein 10 n=1 Tax=Nosema granulosis TaxID=83296 RepID=A0A9P6GZQ2_9MICR|nr:Nucleolar protein 10 [Nosema granulosis]
MIFSEIHQIKNFEYSVACTDMKLSESKKILTSIGTYRPSVKTHDLFNLSQKTERHLESDAVRVEPLDKDAEKLCVLRVDRFLEFHAKYGMHDRIRMPSLCFDVKLNKFKANVLCVGKSNEVYRFCLEKGRFESPYLTTIKAINSVSINNVHGLIGLCGEKKIQFIDQRTSSIVSSTQFEHDFTSMDFSENGIFFSTGTTEGDVMYFDLRSKTPLGRHSHQGEIKKIQVVGRNTISTDDSSIKIFREEVVLGEIKLRERINTFETCGGVIFVGCDSPNMKTFYSTEFGDIPSWCKIVKTEE